MDLSCKVISLCLNILYLLQESCQVELQPLDYVLLKSFLSSPGTRLNHFTVSENINIYIGGVGRLYHLSRDFDVLANVSTEVNNINKILSIAPQPVNRLISCGSGLNGTCQLRYLDNLTDTGDQTLSSLKFSEDENTTLGLVVNHPPGAPVSLALYVAKSIGKESDAPIQVKCLSKHNGQECNIEDSTQANNFDSNVDPNFFIRYASSFSYGGYTYYFASQLLDATGTETSNFIVPKLSRVCQTESGSEMNGFTEITLGCRGKDNTLYNIVQSAVVVEVQLFAIFVKNDGDTYFDPTNQSALCVYDMKNLTQEFSATTTTCACGDGDSQMYSSSNYLGQARCRLVQSLQHCESLSAVGLPCEVSYGSRVFARYPERAPSLGFLPGEVVFEYSGETFTSIVITETVVQNTTQKVAFIGSKEGHLLKVQFNETQLSGVLYEKVDVQDPVLSDTWLGNDSIIVLTETKLLELSVANCSQHQTCSECLRGDPYCGWCTLKGR